MPEVKRRNAEMAAYIYIYVFVDRFRLAVTILKIQL
jgi:hypothetical protein